jgi:hypothetical protein
MLRLFRRSGKRMRQHGQQFVRKVADAQQRCLQCVGVAAVGADVADRQRVRDVQAAADDIGDGLGFGFAGCQVAWAYSRIRVEKVSAGVRPVASVIVRPSV